MSRGYNGHRSKAAWSVALWLGGDEDLYRMALEAVKRCRTKDRAARSLMNTLLGAGIVKTPDGAKYSVTTIRAALSGLT